MINLDHVHFQDETVIYFLPNIWKYLHNCAFLRGSFCSRIYSDKFPTCYAAACFSFLKYSSGSNSLAILTSSKYIDQWMKRNMSYRYPDWAKTHYFGSSRTGGGRKVPVVNISRPFCVFRRHFYRSMVCLVHSLRSRRF
jgi:hypothetical protein